MTDFHNEEDYSEEGIADRAKAAVSAAKSKASSAASSAKGKFSKNFQKAKPESRLSKAKSAVGAHLKRNAGKYVQGAALAASATSAFAVNHGKWGKNIKRAGIAAGNGVDRAGAKVEKGLDKVGERTTRGINHVKDGAAEAKKGIKRGLRQGREVAAGYRDMGKKASSIVQKGAKEFHGWANKRASHAGGRMAKVAKEDLELIALHEEVENLIAQETMQMTALESIDNNGLSEALEAFFQTTDGYSINGLYAQISEEGVVDFVKEKLTRLTDRIQQFANKIYGKVTGKSEEIDHLIERAREHGEGDQLPIGKATAVIVALGGLAAVAAAATFCGKALADGKAGDIKERANKVGKDLIAKITSRGKKSGKISGRELKTLASRIGGDVKRNVSGLMSHLKNHKGEYATAAAVTAAVTGVGAGGYKFHSQVKDVTKATGMGYREAAEANARFQAHKAKDAVKSASGKTKEAAIAARDAAKAAPGKAKEEAGKLVGKAKGLLGR